MKRDKWDALEPWERADVVWSLSRPWEWASVSPREAAAILEVLESLGEPGPSRLERAARAAWESLSRCMWCESLISQSPGCIARGGKCQDYPLWAAVRRALDGEQQP